MHPSSAFAIERSAASNALRADVLGVDRRHANAALGSDEDRHAKGTVLSALSLPENPDQLFDGHARTLDAAYRQVAGRLGPDAKVTVDDERKVHVAALKAIPDPASLVELRGLLEGMVPRVSVPGAILEVMSWHPEFVQAFNSISGGRTRLQNLDGDDHRVPVGARDEHRVRSDRQAGRGADRASRAIGSRSGGRSSGGETFARARRRRLDCSPSSA
jgi:hypothetical protein